MPWFLCHIKKEFEQVPKYVLLSVLLLLSLSLIWSYGLKDYSICSAKDPNISTVTVFIVNICTLTVFTLRFFFWNFWLDVLRLFSFLMDTFNAFGKKSQRTSKMNKSPTHPHIHSSTVYLQNIKVADCSTA